MNWLTGLDRRAFLGAVAAGVIGRPAAVFAQQADFGERKVEPLDLPLDKPGVWTLHFRYKPPRIITVDGFTTKDGQIQKDKPVWYMWYQVYNLPLEGRAAEPVTFMPEFELVTKDLNTNHLDEIQPLILEQINKIENPQKHPRLEVLSSIAISKRPIPPSKPDAIPIPVTGAAIWTEVPEGDVSKRTNKFSVYITGLSNGQATEELVRTGEKLIKRKTLQINFIRPTDDLKPQITDIRPDPGPENRAEQWIYRTSSVAKAIGGAPKMPPPPPG